MNYMFFFNDIRIKRSFLPLSGLSPNFNYNFGGRKCSIPCLSLPLYHQHQQIQSPNRRWRNRVDIISSWLETAMSKTVRALVTVTRETAVSGMELEGSTWADLCLKQMEKCPNYGGFGKFLRKLQIWRHQKQIFVTNGHGELAIYEIFFFTLRGNFIFNETPRSNWVTRNF